MYDSDVASTSVEHARCVRCKFGAVRLPVHSCAALQTSGILSYCKRKAGVGEDANEIFGSMKVRPAERQCMLTCLSMCSPVYIDSCFHSTAVSFVYLSLGPHLAVRPWYSMKAKHGLSYPCCMRVRCSIWRRPTLDSVEMAKHTRENHHSRYLACARHQRSLLSGSWVPRPDLRSRLHYV